MSPAPAPSTLVLACGALVHELLAICAQNRLDHVRVECLPASLHMEPSRIPAALRARLDNAIDRFEHVLVGYADCGTAGEIDRICDDYGVARLPGAHCYEFFAGRDRFAALHDADPTVFYLTDYLARHFDRLVLDTLGITAHPELAELYFGNYTRVCYLAQTDDPELDRRARQAAERLGLEFERIASGYGELEPAVVAIGRRAAVPMSA